jgi:hypothetical protein
MRLGQASDLGDLLQDPMRVQQEGLLAQEVGSALRNAANDIWTVTTIQNHFLLMLLLVAVSSSAG